MKYQGKSKSPLILIHGGAGRPVEAAKEATAKQALTDIINSVWQKLNSGADAVEAVALANRLLEDCGVFNAGKGAVLQSDGAARLTASLMDGSREKFSAIHNIQGTNNPSEFAKNLQNQSDHILDGHGGILLAQQLNIALNQKPSAEQIQKLQSAKSPTKHSTIGAVALDKNGKLAAATSTGGILNAFPGRMSDVGTVAGNFATNFAAISCTGIGDHIVNTAGAARLEARVRDGKSIVEASEKQLSEVELLKCDYGWIAIDKDGNWTAYYSSAAMSFAVRGKEDTKELIVVNNTQN